MGKNIKVLVVLIAFLLSTFTLPTTKVMAANTKPVVIPELQEWTGGTGSFFVTTSSRICVDPSYLSQLANTASVFQEDMLAMSGRNLNIVNTASPAAGDFYLTLNCTDTGIGNEGYLFDVGSYTTIKANTAKGVFYGTRTALQILKQASGMSIIPQGSARDYPKWKERGFLLDAGRMHFPLSTIRDYVKYLGWYKMNDFQLHLSDNQPCTYDNWQAAQSAFRLESSTYPGLTATDGSYTKQQFTDLQNLAAKYGVTIIPEIDSPAHSLAFIKYRPSLQHPTYGADHLDLSNPDTQIFMNGIWDEFVPLFQSPMVHIGTDEYNQEGSLLFRNYINTNDNYLHNKGKQVWMWGSLDMMGRTDVNRDITVECWANDWYNPQHAVADGYNVVNTLCNYLYIVPYGGYFRQYLDTNWLFNNWEPYNFGGAAYDLSPTEPKLQGGLFCVWNDRLGIGYDTYDVYNRVESAVQVLSQKLWSGTTSQAYSSFMASCNPIGNAPGTNLEYTEPAIGNIAADKSVMESSEETDTGLWGNFAVDSKPLTRWSSGYSDNEWLYVDLGQQYNNINRVRLNWEAAYGKGYKIQVSNDPQTGWTDVYSTTNGDGGIDDITFTPVNARYVRLYGTQRALQSYGYSLYEFEVYNNNTVADWEFSEGSGTSTTDVWNSYTATLVGGTTWETGRDGQALYFNGTTTGLNVGKADILVPWTASMWVKRKDSSNTSDTLMGSSSAALKLEQYNNTNKVGFSKIGVGDYAFNYTAPVDKWVNLTFVGTSAGTYLYVNGSRQDFNPAVINCPMDSIGYSRYFNNDYLYGTLDSVKVYNSALSPAQIAGVANAGVANWKFDENNGDAYDSWSGYTAAVTGGVSRAVGMSGNAIVLNGTDAGAIIGASDIPVPWTASMWVKKNAVQASSVLLSSPNAELKLDQWNNTGKVGFTKIGVNDFAFNYSVPVGSWQNLTFVGTSSGTSLYVNGTLVETNPNVINCPMDTIGYWRGANGAKADFLNCALDEIRLYDRALSQSEINGVVQGQAHYWALNEGSGITVSDAWGDKTGTISGATWTTGYTGNALSFNGSSNGVYIGRADIKGNWTASMWVNRNDSYLASVSLMASAENAIKLEQYNNTNKVGISKIGVGDYAFNYTVPAGTWTNLAFVGTSTGTSLYVNGVFQETINVRIDCPMETLGYLKGNFNSEFLYGKLDEIKVFDRALSSTEISALLP